MIDALFSVDLTPGKKANDDITFMSSALEYAGINIFKDISLKFNVFDSDTWEGFFITEQIAFTANNNVNHAQTYDDSGFEVLNSDGFKVVVKHLDLEDSFWGADLHLYIENNYSKDVTFQVRNVSVNGFMVTPMFSCDILNGMKAFDSISFFDSDLEANSITDIKNIELSFHIFDKDNWDTILDTEQIIISFE